MPESIVSELDRILESGQIQRTSFSPVKPYSDKLISMKCDKYMNRIRRNQNYLVPLLTYSVRKQKYRCISKETTTTTKIIQFNSFMVYCLPIHISIFMPHACNIWHPLHNICALIHLSISRIQTNGTHFYFFFLQYECVASTTLHRT